MRFHHSPLNSPAIAIAVWLAAWTLRPMFTDSGFLAWVPVLVAVPAIIGAVGVLLRAPRAATLVVQVIGMSGVLLWLGFRDAPAPANPDHPVFQPLYLLGQLGTSTVRNSSTPLPTEPGLVWLLLCILALVVVALEVLVNGLEQPSWALAPLAVVYGVGALTLPAEMEFSSFAAVAVGYAVLLLTSTHLAGITKRRPGFQATRLAVGVATLLAALVLAPLLTQLVPLGEKQPWLQAGRNKPIELSDPKIELNENLRRPAEQVVLRYRTDSEVPIYLRTVALTRLSTSGAELTALKLATSGLRGASTAPGRRVETSVRMLMPSEYLPVPFVVDEFSADGSWAHDRNTMSIVATGNSRTEQTTGLEYDVVSTVPDPDREELEAATAGVDSSGDDTLTVPEGLDAAVPALADSITAGADTDGQKALAIQSYLRSPEFTYSLDAPDSAGMDAISAFLLDNRAGYCIHFAAGMITLARLEGIPARMAIGFTPGEKDGDEWIVTTHNMHSWPELYFEGLGWVPFEPTKSIVGPPEYTNPDVGEGPAASPSPSPSPTSVPSAPPSVSAEPTEEPTVAPTPPSGESGDGNGAGWLLLLGVGVLLALPFGSRTIARQWRLRAGQDPTDAAEGAWREVHALFLDAGLEWNEASPVLAGDVLANGLEPPAAAELAVVAGTVERTRYARDGADTSELAAQVKGFRREFLRTLPGDKQLRALLLPSSLVSGRTRRE